MNEEKEENLVYEGKTKNEIKSNWIAAPCEWLSLNGQKKKQNTKHYYHRSQ